MAVNRYDQPAQADFINTYVPIPFDQMMKVGMLKQSMVEQNDKISDEIMAGMTAMKVTPADEPAYRDKMNEVRTEINNILNTTAPGSYEGKRKILDLRHRLSLDQDMREWSANYPTYLKGLDAKSKADEKRILAPNRSALDKQIADFSSGGKGTRGLREETGFGIYKPVSYSDNIDTYKEIEQLVNDVDDSNFKRDYSTGKWIVTKEEGGKTLDALGAPVGISFVEGSNKEGKYYKTEIQDMDKFMDRLVNTTWGQQHITNAQYSLGKPQGTIDNEVLSVAAEAAKNDMVSAIKERVTRNSSKEMRVDPYGMKAFEDDLENRKMVLSYDQATVLKGSDIPDKSALFTETKAAESNLEDASKSFEALKTGATALPVYDRDDKGNVKTDANGNPVILTYEYKDSNAEDITDEVRKREAAVKLAQNKHQDLLNLEREVRKETADKLNVDVNYEPSMSLKKKALRKALTRGPALGETAIETIVALMRFNFKNSADLGNLTQTVSETIDKYYQNELERIDPFTQEFNRNLDKRSKDSVIDIGLSDFSDKRINEELESDFLKYGLGDSGENAGGARIQLKDAYKDEPLNPDDYKKLSRDEKPLYKGWSQNVNTGELELHYKAYNNETKKDGSKVSKDVTMKAPNGFVSYLLKDGLTEEAELYIAGQLTNAEMGVDNKNIIVLKGPNNKEYGIEVTALSSQAKKQYVGSPNYMLRFVETSAAVPGRDDLTRATEYTREEAIAKIKGYGIALWNANK